MSSAMKRVPSFGRKPKRDSPAASAESASCEESSGRQSDAGAERAAEKPSSAGSRLGRLARSASFGRAMGKRPVSGTETGSGSSQSSPEASDTASPGPALPCDTVLSAPSTRGLGSLHGCLLKKHTRDKTVSYQWATRYFLVDDVQGTLCYSKGVTKKPSVVLPLIDITSVQEVEESHHGFFGFMVSCPPVHLTLCAEDKEDRQLWVQGLRRRVKLWQDRAAATGEPNPGHSKRQAALTGLAYPVVSPSPLAPLPVVMAYPAPAEGASGADAAAPALESAVTDEDNRAAPAVAVIKTKKKKKKKDEPNDEHTHGGGAESSFNTTEASGQSKQHEGGGSPPGLRFSRSGSRSPRVSRHSSRARIGPAGTDAASDPRAHEGTDAAAPDDEESEVIPPGASKIETMEVMSDSDSEDGHSSKNRSAISREASDWARLAPKGNLNELLSSDEEEAKEEVVPKDVPMPMRVVPETNSTPLVIENPFSEERHIGEEGAAQQGISSARRSTESQSQSLERPWGSSQPLQDGAMGSPDLPMPSGPDAAVDEGWDSEDELQGASPKRRGAASRGRLAAAPASDQPPSGGPGIIADKNFVEDDWDSDEE